MCHSFSHREQFDSRMSPATAYAQGLRDAHPPGKTVHSFKHMHSAQNAIAGTSASPCPPHPPTRTSKQKRFLNALGGPAQQQSVQDSVHVAERNHTDSTNTD